MNNDFLKFKYHSCVPIDIVFFSFYLLFPASRVFGIKFCFAHYCSGVAFGLLFKIDLQLKYNGYLLGFGLIFGSGVTSMCILYVARLSPTV